MYRLLGLSGMEENEARRRGLEKFLIRIARHPVLASTKLFREFLTAKDEKVHKYICTLHLYAPPPLDFWIYICPLEFLALRHMPLLLE